MNDTSSRSHAIFTIVFTQVIVFVYAIIQLLPLSEVYIRPIYRPEKGLHTPYSLKNRIKLYCLESYFYHKVIQQFIMYFDRVGVFSKSFYTDLFRIVTGSI